MYSHMISGRSGVKRVAQSTRSCDLRVHRRDHVGLGARAGEARRDVALAASRSGLRRSRPRSAPVGSGPRRGATRRPRREPATRRSRCPSDHMMIDGWFLSRCAMRVIRSSTAGVHIGSLREAAQVRVGLDVGLVEHVHAEPVAHVVEVHVVRVVRRAHRVDVVLLHQHDVGLDRRRASPPCPGAGRDRGG